MEKNQDYYTVKELADILGISRIAVFKKIQKGQIKAEKNGRNYIISKDNLKLDAKLSSQLEKKIKIGVDKVVSEYGETLKLLEKE